MSLTDAAGNIADRLKKAREKHTGEPADEKPVDYEELYTLRARILGILIRDARLARNRTLAQCAASLGVDEQTVAGWEYGLTHPSLPQLELLSYDLGVPVSHFWSTELMSDGQVTLPVPQAEYTALRNRVVGALIRQAREDAGMAMADISERTGLSVEQIESYEIGQAAIPLTELTSLASAINVSLSFFLENNNRIGYWLLLQEKFQRYSELPEDVQAFISNPSNKSFIELSMWFAALGVNDLRGIAESILHLSRLDSDKMRTIAEGILNDITL